MVIYLAPYVTIMLILFLNPDDYNFDAWIWEVTVINFYLSALLIYSYANIALVNYYVDYWIVNNVLTFLLKFIMANLITFSITTVISGFISESLYLLKKFNYIDGNNKWIKPKRKKEF